MWLTWCRIINAAMLLLAIPRISPYGYYNLLRIVTCVLCGVLSYLSYQTQRKEWSIIFGIMAIVFNPIVPFYLGKRIWVGVDALSAIILIVSLFQVKSDDLKKAL